MTDKERIDYIIKYSKMNMSEFARHIDLKGPYRIYDVRNEKNGISKDLARMIHAKFSNFNLGWILTGNGEIFQKDEDEKRGSLINDKAESYNTPDVKIPQKDFSSLIETMNIQQKTIDRLTKTVEELTKKNDGTKNNGENANSA